MQRVLLILVLLLAAALAFIHWVLPGQVERGMNVYLPSELPEISREARDLHATLFVADLHTDSMLWKRDFLERSDIGHVDLPRLQDGNVALQIFSATTKSPAGQNYDENSAEASDRITLLAVLSLWPARTWTSIYERAVFQLEKLYAFAEQSDLTVIRSQQEMRDLIDRRERGEPAVGAIYLIEGAHPLEGELGKLDALFEQGMRIAGLTHFFDNELGGSLHGQSGEGLSPFGRDVIRRADELGVIIDVAHASPKMVSDVLSINDRPVILSHGGLKGNCDTARNLSDELMVRIAAEGGLVGIGFWDAAVCDPSPEGIVRAIRYGIDLLGEDHVALGSDYDGTVAVTLHIGELIVLTEVMLRAGFTEQEIRKVMGENVKRFMLENLPNEAP